MNGIKELQSHVNRSVTDKTPLYEYNANALKNAGKLKVIELLLKSPDITKYPEFILSHIKSIIKPGRLMKDLIIFDIYDLLTEDLKKCFQTDILEFLVNVKFNHKNDILRSKAILYLKNHDTPEELSLINHYENLYNKNTDITSTVEDFKDKVNNKLKTSIVIPNINNSVTVTEFSKLSCYVNGKKSKLNGDNLKLFLLDIFNIDSDFFITNITLKEKGYYLSELLHCKTQDLIVLEKEISVILEKLSLDYDIDIHFLEKIIIFKGFYSKNETRNPFLNQKIVKILIKKENIIEIQNYLEEFNKTNKKDLK